MARENRKENRARAKNENKEELDDEIGGGGSEDISDMLDVEEGEDDVDELLDSSKFEEDKDEDDIDPNVNENAEKSEVEKKTDTTSVEKKAEAEGEKKEEGSDKTVTEVKKGDEVAAGEKKPDGKAETEKKEPEPVKKPEPTAEKQEQEKKEEKTELSTEDATKLFTDWRASTETLLADHHYRLTDEQVAELNDNPAAFIPKMASRVYLDCISASFQQFVQYLPRMVHQVLEQRKEIEENDNKFFSKWPDLKPHKEAVIRLGAAYRQSNPTATMDDFINEVGALAMVSLRIAPEGEKKQEQTQQIVKPFTPATGAPANSAPPAKKPNNVFEALVDDWSVEDAPEG